MLLLKEVQLMSMVVTCRQDIPAAGIRHPSSERRNALRSWSIALTSCFRDASLNAWDDDMSNDSSKFEFDIVSEKVAERDYGSLGGNGLFRYG